MLEYSASIRGCCWCWGASFVCFRSCGCSRLQALHVYVCVWVFAFGRKKKKKRLPGAFRREERPPYFRGCQNSLNTMVPKRAIHSLVPSRLEHTMAPGAGVISSTPCCLGGCWPSKQKKGCEKAEASTSNTLSGTPEFRLRQQRVVGEKSGFGTLGTTTLSVDSYGRRHGLLSY